MESYVIYGNWDVFTGADMIRNCHEYYQLFAHKSDYHWPAIINCKDVSVSGQYVLCGRISVSSDTGSVSGVLVNSGNRSTVSGIGMLDLI